MTYLPPRESTVLATKADLDALEARLGSRIDGGLGVIDQRFEAVDRLLDAVSQNIDRVSQRIDRMVLTWLPGVVAITATLVVQSLI